MIKFFRKIRQNLLKENKTSKYFKYAIGEIVLVVIGILIALQINNWNEFKKQKAKEKELLAYVLDNLKKDSLTIAQVLKTRESIVNVHINLISFTKGELQADAVGDIDLIRRSFPNVLVTRENNPNLANEVLDQNLKKNIIAYYSSISFAEFVMKNSNDFIENKVRYFLGEHQLLNYGNQFNRLNENNSINKTKFFEAIQKPELQQILFEAGIKLSTLNVWGNNTAFENENLKNAITKYLATP